MHLVTSRPWQGHRGSFGQPNEPAAEEATTGRGHLPTRTRTRAAGRPAPLPATQAPASPFGHAPLPPPPSFGPPAANVPAFASTTPRLAADTYGSTPFGYAVAAVAVGAAVATVGLARLWRLLRP